ncbi:hypothetical protein OG874_19665 [Nocardia sp. NBC_00565]|uniref:hypothetical protein n=1 Tax=Nocardia sp. NBC_00565 TaxID=2975993 RepID=UPI002E80BF88|nr:hypothetical protein [Nocardia sp. NBC_00565]WUC07174.1 hypothetical protein OG874_19665 [Nocardia sp. NBC_00565]
MKPMDTGVIAPDGQSVAIEEAVIAAQNTAVDALQNVANQGLSDLSLPQLPADLPPIEAPEFVLARKITEESPQLGTMPGGMPGLNGNSTPDAGAILSGAVPQDVSQMLTDANTAISHAAAPVAQAAQSVAQHAQSALSGALGGSSTQTAAAVPDVTTDPVSALMQGLSIPGIPGIDTLFQPILQLLSSFGTGVIGAFDPTAILSQSSKVIEAAVSVGKGGLQTVEQLWEGQSSREAQAASKTAETQGQDTSQRGIDISELTQRAAAVVQQGNAQLLGIASSFATQATAMVPVALTPPGQAVLIASATEHLGQAVTVANATRGDLAGKTAELTGLVNQLLGTSGLPAPQEVAQAVMQNIGEPILEQAQSAASDASTNAAGLLDGSSTSGSPSTSTTTASMNSGHTSTGSPGITGMSGGSGSLGSTGSPSTQKVTGTPGSSVSPISRITGMSGTSFGTGTSTSAAGNSFMGGSPGATGQRGGGDDEHSRNVEPYQSRTGNDDLTGPLGESTPDVIGATHPDELVSSDYEQDQF